MYQTLITHFFYDNTCKKLIYSHFPRLGCPRLPCLFLMGRSMRSTNFVSPRTEMRMLRFPTNTVLNKIDCTEINMAYSKTGRTMRSKAHHNPSRAAQGAGADGPLGRADPPLFRSFSLLRGPGASPALCSAPGAEAID